MSNHYRILKQTKKPRITEVVLTTKETIGIILLLGLISFLIRLILFGIILQYPV